MPRRAASVLACMLLAATAGPTLHAQAELRAASSRVAADNFGVAVAGAGDVDDDGLDDVVVGIWGDDTNGTDAGAAIVISGADGAVIRTWLGTDPGDLLGCAVAGVGDIDGDDHDDVLVGAPGADDAATDGGAAYVFSGFDGAVLLTFDNDDPDAQLGWAVDAAGDVDGDGTPDAVVGSPDWDNPGQPGNGLVQVFSGVDGAEILRVEGDQPLAHLGFSVSGLGDVNGDLKADIVVGTYSFDDVGCTNCGRVRIISGATGVALKTFSGEAGGDELGRSVDSVDDVDGDGRPDVVVGFWGDDDAGRDAGGARVFGSVSGAVLWDLDGDGGLDLFGHTVAGVGDVNADGRGDFAVGAVGDDDAGSNAGSVRVFSGLDGSVLFNVWGAAPGERFGTALAGAGDTNGDGVPDLVIGAPGSLILPATTGRIEIRSGRPYTDLGNGLAGTHGVPLFTGSGYLTDGQDLGLHLSGALESSSANLIVGFGTISVPFKGGVLVPTPDVVIPGLPTGPLGQIDIVSPWVSGIPPGLLLYFQYWISDPAAPQGLSASNALSGISG